MNCSAEGFAPDIYRVQQRWNRPGLRHVQGDHGQHCRRMWRVPTKPWHRTWQAEWDGCRRAPRAFTRRGLVRRAWRWFNREQLTLAHELAARADGIAKFHG